MLLLIVTFAFVAACDTIPGPSSSAGDPPLLSDFQFDPHEVAATGDGDTMTVPLSMRVTVTDPENDVAEVAYVVQSPTAGEDPIARGTLQSAGGAWFEGSTDLALTKGEIGVYTVLVYAVDEQGSLSNNVRGNLRFFGEGEPPAIEDVIMPESVTRPAPGEDAKQISIVAVVSDPDGLTNISRIEFWNVETPASRISMVDTGDDGDAEAGDGRYTTVVEITSSNRPVVNTLAFQATDKAGLQSSIVERDIEVE